MHIGDLLEELGRPVVIYPALARVVGRNECIFICQFMYWKGKEHSEDGFIYKTSDEIEAETTLSYKEQLTVRKNLKERGILEEYEKRLLHRIYYKINQDALSAAFSQQLSRSSPKEGGESILEQPAVLPEGSSLTESTTEITSESTTYNVNVGDVVKVNSEESQVTDRADSPRHPSVIEAMKHIAPSPTLVRERMALSELPVDERPFAETPKDESISLRLPFLIHLIGISREIGCEIRWDSYQEAIKDAIFRWGEQVIEKEFRDYGAYVAGLTNKTIRWDKFKLNRLDKLPTLQEFEAEKQRRNHTNVGPQKIAAPMPRYAMDAWAYMRAMENNEEPITDDTLAKLREKFTTYQGGAMRMLIEKFLEKHSPLRVAS